MCQFEEILILTFRAKYPFILGTAADTKAQPFVMTYPSNATCTRGFCLYLNCSHSSFSYFHHTLTEPRGRCCANLRKLSSSHFEQTSPFFLAQLLMQKHSPS